MKQLTLTKVLLSQATHFIKGNIPFLFFIFLIKSFFNLLPAFLPDESGKVIGAISTVVADIFFLGFMAAHIIEKSGTLKSLKETVAGFFPLLSASLFYSVMVLVGLATIIGAPYIAARFLFLPLVAFFEDPQEGRLKRATALSKGKMGIGVFLFVINLLLGVASTFLLEGDFTPLYFIYLAIFGVTDLFFDLFLIYFYENRRGEFKI